MNMPIVSENQMTVQEDYIEVWVEMFLQSKKIENLSRNSLRFYAVNLKGFANWCNNQSVKTIGQITPDVLRQFLLFLGEHHNVGGIHVYFRAIRSFLNWYEQEVEPDNWKNPTRKVKAPKLIVEPIQGITADQLIILLDACGNNTLGQRDKAILLTLLDSGIRADELINIRISDVNLVNNSILIAMGKGRKFRSVFIGKLTRRQIRKYLRLRKHKSEYLFCNKSGDKLCYSGLRQILRRLNTITGLKLRLHDFRRGFCLASLQAGVDLQTLSRLMGHVSINLVSRYANQSSNDIQSLYRSPVDSN